MKAFNRRKASKVTLKTHHKHHALPKEEAKLLKDGINEISTSVYNPQIK